MLFVWRWILDLGLASPLAALFAVIFEQIRPLAPISTEHCHLVATQMPIRQKVSIWGWTGQPRHMIPRVPVPLDTKARVTATTPALTICVGTEEPRH